MHCQAMTAHLVSPRGIRIFEEVRVGEGEKISRWRIGKLEDEDESGDEIAILPGQDSDRHLRNAGAGSRQGERVIELRKVWLKHSSSHPSSPMSVTGGYDCTSVLTIR